jgi:hypothetical protein
MLMRRGEGSYPGAYRRGKQPSGNGFFNAPWWLLLLWMVIFVAALFLAAELGII